MSDQGLLLGELERAAARGEAIALASIVHTAGSAYRGVGTRMVIRADDSSTGLVSGGCLEADLIDHAARARASGRPALVTYDSRSADDLVWGLGLGCDGMVQVLVEPLSPERARELATLLRAAHRERDPLVLATITDGTAAGSRLLMDTSGREIARTGSWDDARVTAALARAADAAVSGRRGLTCEIGDVAMSLEAIAPPVEVVVCGSGPDAVPVATLAAAQGWSVTVIDHRALDDAHPERFPAATVVECAAPDTLATTVALDDRTAVVVMSHHYPRDLEYVAAALRSCAAYVGVLGPRRRTERMLGELEARGTPVDPAMLERLYAPIGLDIGGDAPETVALSIVAEISAVSSGRAGGVLRDRRAPIHDAPPAQPVA